MTNLSKTIAILGVVAGLGVAALPLSTYAADETVTDPAVVEWDGTGDAKVTEDTKINLTIEDVLSIDTDANVVNLNSGNNYTGTALGVKVISNNSKGYTLNIKGSAATNPTSLTSTTVSTDVIAASSVKFADAAALALEGGNSVWGYSVDGANFAGVTEDGENIVTKGVATAAAGETTNVTFKAVLKDGQASGTYTGQVTFTAANQPNA